MRVALTVADVLAEHVTIELECIDRMFLNVYQPRLQYAAGLVGYVQRQLGLPIASTAPLATVSDRFIRAVQRFAKTEGIEWVDFAKGQRKDAVMQEELSRPVDQDLLRDHDFGVLVGRPFDELAFAERGAGSDEGDKVRRVHRAPAALSRFNELERHRQPGRA